MQLWLECNQWVDVIIQMKIFILFTLLLTFTCNLFIKQGNVRNNLDIHCYNFLAQNVNYPNFFNDSGKLSDVILKLFIYIELLYLHMRFCSNDKVLESDSVSFLPCLILRITIVHYSGIKYFSFNEWNPCSLYYYVVKQPYSIIIHITKKYCDMTNILRKRNLSKLNWAFEICQNI